MSHIVSFAIKGLAGRKGVYAKTLNRDVNVFFGLNGAGKTSLLRIIDAAMSNSVVSLLNVPFDEARVTVHSMQYDADYTYSFSRPDALAAISANADLFTIPTRPSRSIRPSREGVLSFTTTSKRASEIVDWTASSLFRPAPEWTITPPLPEKFKQNGGQWNHRFLPTSRLFQIAKTEERDRDDDYYNQAFESAMQRQWSGFYNHLQSSVRRIQEKGLADILQIVLGQTTTLEPGRNMSWKDAYARVSSFLKRASPSFAIPTEAGFKMQFENSENARSIVALIDKVELEIAHALEPRNKLAALLAKMFTGNKEVHFGSSNINVTLDGETDIGLKALSSGEKQLIRIFVEVLHAGESSLLIDEPELSMHVDWQRELISSMLELNPDAQLILATHSPEIMANLDNSKIFAV